MRKRISNNTGNERYLDQKTGPGSYNLGLQSFLKLARKAGAERRIGKRCIYDVQKIDAYLAEHDKVDLF